MNNNNGDASYGTAGQVLTSGGPKGEPTWGSGGSSGSPVIRVETQVLGPNDFSSFSNQTYAQVITAQISKDANRDILIRAMINFTYGCDNSGDDGGGVAVDFKLMRRFGTSGAFTTQVGEFVQLDHLMGVNSGGGTGRFNMFAGLAVPDASITGSAYNIIQYAVFAKYDTIGDGASDPLTILAGSSIVAMEF